jgi:PAS domain S-box-containing protein
MAAAVFLLFCAFALVVGLRQRGVWLDEIRADIRLRLTSIGLNLATGINRRAAVLKGLAAMAELHGADSRIRTEFSLYAAALHGDDRAIKAISLYPPAGTVLVYPMETNTAMLGRKLADLVDYSRAQDRAEIDRMISNARPTFSAPYRLPSGSAGVLTRKAISRGGRFWGIAEVILDIGQLLEDSGFGPVSADLVVALADSSGTVFEGDRRALDSDPVRFEIPLPEGSWSLCALPSGGWTSRILLRFVILELLGILLAFLLAMTARMMARKYNSITERISDQEQVLAENRKWLELAVSASSIGFFEYDIRSRSVLRSPEYESQLGYGKGEMPLENSFWEESLHPEDREAALRTETDCIEGRTKGYEMEYRLRHRDGSWRWILGRGKVIADSAGEPLRLFGCHIDISRIKEAEEGLKKSEERYRAIMKNLPLGMIHIMDRDFRYVFDSGEEMDRLGLTEEMLVGKSIYEILDPPTAATVASQYRKVLAGESVRYEGNYKGENFLVQAVPLKDSSGNVEQILALSVNVTERKVTETKLREAHDELRLLLAEAERSRLALLSLVEDRKAAESEIRKLNEELEERVRDRTARLQEANRELEAFAYSVSHDLRSPLRSMNGFASALMAEYGQALDEKAMHYLERIKDASLRMGDLINDLLALAQISRYELGRETVDLSAVATRIACGLEDSEPGRNAVFEIEPGLEARGDPRLLEILMANLIGNAWKYSGKRESSLIHVGREEREGRTAFFVKDNGVGFDMAYAAQLFLPFHRLHRADEFPGTGIGLATVHRIVTRHGGRIWPDAEIGVGATFRFTLDGSGGN